MYKKYLCKFKYRQWYDKEADIWFVYWFFPYRNSLIQAPYFLYHYITPYTRASTYIIGVVFGYVLFRTQGMKIKMNRPLLTFGWITCTILVYLVFMGFYTFQLEHHEFNRMEHSIFLSLSRSAWTISMVWIVWVCVNGYGGEIKNVHFYWLCIMNFILISQESLTRSYPATSSE